MVDSTDCFFASSKQVLIASQHIQMKTHWGAGTKKLELCNDSVEHLKGVARTEAKKITVGYQLYTFTRTTTGHESEPDSASAAQRLKPARWATSVPSGMTYALISCGNGAVMCASSRAALESAVRIWCTCVSAPGRVYDARRVPVAVSRMNATDCSVLVRRITTYSRA